MPPKVSAFLALGLILFCAIARAENYEDQVLEVETDSIEREKRSLTVSDPLGDPIQVLKEVHDAYDLTDDEVDLVKSLRLGEDHLLLLRIKTSSFNHTQNLTDPMSTERAETEGRIKSGLRGAIVDYEGLVKTVRITDVVEEAELDEHNATFHAISMVLVAQGRAVDIIDAMTEDFTKRGILGEDIVATYIYPRAYAPVTETTVYTVMLRLNELAFMPQFRNLNNSATLRITNEMLLTTRPLMRNCFGEFFFRSVVLEYREGPLLGDTIVYLGILLEESEYNVVDMDKVWVGQAKLQGVLGNYKLGTHNFLIYETDYIPEAFENFLIAEVTRAERTLDTQEFVFNIAIPTASVILFVIILVLFCAWEGFCCKKIIEDENCCCCNIGSYTQMA